MFGNSPHSAPSRARVAALRTGLAVTAVTLSALLVACGGDKEKKATQVAAKVNKEEITVHQINFVLARQAGLKPEQKDEASRLILENLINKELVYQKAVEQKVDRDPNVLEAIEMTKRELVVQAYLEKVAAGARPPRLLVVALPPVRLSSLPPWAPVRRAPCASPSPAFPPPRAESPSPCRPGSSRPARPAARRRRPRSSFRRPPPPSRCRRWPPPGPSSPCRRD